MAGFMLGLMRGIESQQVESAKNQAKQTALWQRQWDQTVRESKAVLSKEQANDTEYRRVGLSILASPKLKPLIAQLPGSANFDESGIIKLGQQYTSQKASNGASLNDFIGNTRRYLNDIISNNQTINQFNTVKPTLDTTPLDTQTKDAFGIKKAASEFFASGSQTEIGRRERKAIEQSASPDVKRVMDRGNAPKDYGAPVFDTTGRLTTTQATAFKRSMYGMVRNGLSDYVDIEVGKYDEPVAIKSAASSKEISQAIDPMMTLIDRLATSGVYQNGEEGEATRFMIDLFNVIKNNYDKSRDDESKIKNDFLKVIGYMQKTDRNAISQDLDLPIEEFYRKVVPQKKNVTSNNPPQGNNPSIDPNTQIIPKGGIKDFKHLGTIEGTNEPMFTTLEEFKEWVDDSKKSGKDKGNKRGLYRKGPSEDGLEKRDEEYKIRLPNGKLATVVFRNDPSQVDPNDESKDTRIVMKASVGDVMFDDFIWSADRIKKGSN